MLMLILAIVFLISMMVMLSVFTSVANPSMAATVAFFLSSSLMMLSGAIMSLIIIMERGR